MKILIACEFSGIVRDAFLKRGHDAISCDLLPSEKPGPHYQGDVRDILNKQWDMIIAHPDCTYITNSGCRWLDTDITRWKKLFEACEFFRLFLNHPCKKIIIENPIPHKYGLTLIGKKYTQIIQPFMFGIPETKATCLWLKGVPKLIEIDNVKELMKTMPKSKTNKVHYESPGLERWKNRSRTNYGIANAMGEQWG